MQTINFRDVVAFASFNKVNKRKLCYNVGVYFSGWGEGSDHRSMAGGQQ